MMATSTQGRARGGRAAAVGGEKFGSPQMLNRAPNGIAASVLLFVAVTASAADVGSDGPQQLDEIIVTATRSELSIGDAPFSVSTLTDSTLREKRQVRTIPESLRELPGIMVQKTAHGQGSPFIRGFTGFRNLLLIDGIRLNNSVFRDGPNQYWNTVDPLSVSRMEVVRGPSSVLYGSDAIGGTVQVLSRGYGDLDAVEGFDGNAYYRYADAESSNVYRLEMGYGAANGFSAYAGGSYKDFGNLDVADLGEQRNTGYDEKDVDARLEYELAGGSRLILAHQWVDQDDAWRTHRTIFGESWQGTNVGNEQKRALDQERRLTYLQWREGELFGFMEEVSASVSYHEQDEEQDRIRSDGRRDNQGFEVDTTGLWLQASTLSRFGRWTYGAEWYHDDVDSYRRDYAADGSLTAIRPQGPIADDSEYDTYAAFVQDQVPVTDRLSFILGGRYTRAELDAGTVVDPESGDTFSMNEDWSEVTGSARATYLLDDAGDFRLYGGLSQGFRAPNLSDLTRLSTARSNEIETPVENLDPEEFLTYEIGIKVGRDRWWGEASYYYTDIDEMIIRTPTGEVIDGENEVTKKNAGDGHVEGVELQLGYRLTDALTWFGNGTWMDGEVDTFPTSEPVKVTETMDREMPLTLHTGLRWTGVDGRLWLEGLVSYAEEQDDLSTRDQGDTQRIPPGGTPDYTVFTLRSHYQVTRHLGIALALENITDEDYRIHGSGLNEPGRNLVMTLSWRPQL